MSAPVEQVRNRRRPLRVIAAGLVGFALAVGLYWFFTEGPGWPVLSPRGSTIAQFEGHGDQTTASFRVRAGWRIAWQTSGQRFAFAIRGDRSMGTVVDVSEPGQGVTTPPSRGTFLIQVTAEGPWTITVSQGR